MDINELKAKVYDLSKELFRVKEEADAKIAELNNEIVKVNQQIEKFTNSNEQPTDN